jgi:hypothetical protein
MDDLAIMPTIIVADAPKPRRPSTIRETRDYVDEPTRLGRLAPWREFRRRSING